MKELDYGKEYKYPHDFPYHFVNQAYMPEGLTGKKYYQPTDFGFEKEIRKRIEFWEKLRKKTEPHQPEADPPQAGMNADRHG
jgi:putative ATPase